METSTDIAAETIREQLGKILASPGFVHSDRMARFLRFAVEQTIEGHVDSLKESVLGIEVFDRTASFDPRTDTIVRVEARRLRSKLKEYYETHGEHDSVLIEFPKGSYVPTFLKGNGLDGGKLSTKVQAGLVDETKSSNEPTSKKPSRILSPGIAVALGLGLGMVAVSLTLWLTRTPAPVRFSKLTRLTSDMGLTYQPTVSRDGKFLAYASDRSGEGNLDIWVKPVAGGEPIMRLTRNQADDHEPAFSPDGSKVVFRSERDGGGIYSVSVLGGEERLIAAKGRQPRFSPDGTQIAFWTGLPRAGGYGRARGVIYLIPSSGGIARELEPRFAVARSPVWSPDGRYLLLLGLLDEKPKSVGGQEKDGQHDWWVVSLDSKVAVRTGAADLLADHDNYFKGMEPSDWIQMPDGHSILFARTMGEASNIWQVNISPKSWQITGPARQLTSGTATETYPSFSARGLVFAGLDSNSDIWSLPIDANQGKPTGPLELLVQSAAEDTHSSLSRDGKTLAWNSGRAGYPDIWVKDLPSGKESPITEGTRGRRQSALEPGWLKACLHGPKRGTARLLFSRVGEGLLRRTVV